MFVNMGPYGEDFNSYDSFSTKLFLNVLCGTPHNVTYKKNIKI